MEEHKVSAPPATSLDTSKHLLFSPSWHKYFTRKRNHALCTWGYLNPPSWSWTRYHGWRHPPWRNSPAWVAPSSYAWPAAAYACSSAKLKSLVKPTLPCSLLDAPIPVVTCSLCRQLQWRHATSHLLPEGASGDGAMHGLVHKKQHLWGISYKTALVWEILCKRTPNWEICRFWWLK